MRKRIFGFSERDWPDARKLLEEFRKVGRTLRHPKTVEQKRGIPRSRTLIGKPNEAITGPGILTSKTASVWLGPAHSSDEDTGRDVDIHYFLDDEASTSDYISISEPINGKRYVSLLTCPPEV